MPVSTVSYDNVLRGANGKPSTIYNQHATRVLTRATQPQPRWERWTNVMGFDCEFQMESNKTTGKNANKPGRVSVTNYHGEVVYDVFVYLPEKRGFRYWQNSRRKGFGCYKEDVSPDHGARPIAEVAQNLHDIFDGAIMVGHATENDLKIFDSWVFDGVAFRDTQATEVYRGYANPGSIHGPKLSNLARDVLGYGIQGEEHSSVEDAQATMQLYRLNEESIENEQWRRINFKMGTEEEIKAKLKVHLEQCMAEEKLWYATQKMSAPAVPISRPHEDSTSTLMTVSPATIWQIELATTSNKLHAVDSVASLSSCASNDVDQPNTPSPDPSSSHLVNAPGEPTDAFTTPPSSPSTLLYTFPPTPTTANQAVYSAPSLPFIHPTATSTKYTTSSAITQTTMKENAAIKIAYPRPRVTCANRPANYVAATDSIPITTPESSWAKAKANAAVKIAYPLRPVRTMLMEK